MNHAQHWPKLTEKAGNSCHVIGYQSFTSHLGFESPKNLAQTNLPNDEPTHVSKRVEFQSSPSLPLERRVRFFCDVRAVSGSIPVKSWSLGSLVPARVGQLSLAIYLKVSGGKHPQIMNT